MEMKKKLSGLFVAVAFVGFVYSWMCMACMLKQNDVSPEDYVRMSQEMVEQSLQEK